MALCKDSLAFLSVRPSAVEQLITMTLDGHTLMLNPRMTDVYYNCTVCPGLVLKITAQSEQA
eukprot:8008879-Pyramimonas_sp.AAC.1